MVIRDFGAVHFRNYRELFVTFSDRINLFIGGNGQGKTNLAEAIYFLSHLTSFRSRRLEPLLEFGHAVSQLQGTVIKSDGARKARVEITRQGRRAWLDEQAIATLSVYAAQFYALLFNPDSLYSYRQYPAERRAFFDRLLSFLSPDFMSLARGFRTVHAEKNRLLKSKQISSLPDWNQLFVEKASGIIEGRADLVRRLNERLPEAFRRLTGRSESLELVYRPSLRGDRAQDAALLERAAEQELHAGHAMYGPHRDDIQWELDPQRKASFFSQGEFRISLLALKLTVNALLQERIGFRPVIVLDDLFSELDTQVQGRLAAHLQESRNQIFITTTQLPAALQDSGVQVMEIRDGRII